MAKRKRRTAEAPVETTELRIVGGEFRGRKLRYEPFRAGDDPVTRPMKHRLRESIFNLVGVEAKGLHAVDLFAGTGALGLEALSRGARHATFIERHVPTARVIEENIRSLGVEDRSTLLVTSAFVWSKRDLPKWNQPQETPAPTNPPSPFPLPPSSTPPSAIAPWLVFCSPPYAFYVDRRPEMLELIDANMQHAPAGSIIVVEADERFDFSLLGSDWDVRTYLPAVVGVWRKPTAPGPPAATAPSRDEHF